MNLKQAIQDDWILHQSILIEIDETHIRFSPHAHGLMQWQWDMGEWLRDCAIEEWLNDQSQSDD